MGSMVNGIYLPSNGEAGWGNAISDNFRRQSENHVNVKAYGAKGDGSTDDTAAFVAANAAASNIFVPAGTYILNNWAPTTMRLRVRGAAASGTQLKAKAGAAAAVTMSALWQTHWSDLQIDGNALAAKGMVVQGGAAGSQGHMFEKIMWQNASVGLHLATGTPYNQVDKNYYYGCEWNDCTTGFWIDSVNGQEQLIYGGALSTHTTAIRCTNGSLTIFGGQFGTCTDGVLVDGPFLWVTLHDVIMEGETNSIKATGGNWPAHGVRLTNCILQGSSKCVTTSAGGTMVLHAEHCQFNVGNVEVNGNDSMFFDFSNTYAFGSTWATSGASVRHLTTTINGTELNGPVAGVMGYQFGGAGAAAMDTNLYRSAANRLKTDDNFHAVDGVTTKYKAGTPVDGDFATTPPDGTIVVDSSANKIWTRIGGTWKGVVVA